jgi:hypothetical protein
MFDNVLNPFELDDRSIWAHAHCLKVLCKLHCRGSTVRPSKNTSLDPVICTAQIKKSDDLANARAKSRFAKPFWHNRFQCKSYQRRA